MDKDEIDKILDELMESTKAERAKAAEYAKLSYLEKLARRKGFANRAEYQNWLAQQRGFANRVEYENGLAQQKGFTNYIEYRNWQAQRKGFVNYTEYQRDLLFKRGVGTGLSMAKNKNSSKYLGVYVAERLLPKIFQELRMMPHNNEGYDAICKNNYKIDIKSSVLGKANYWHFDIRCNKIADAFLCIGFSGSRDDLVVKYIWIIPANEIVRKRPINELTGFAIYDTEYGRAGVAKYELFDKVDDANDVCILFKTGFLK